MQVTMKQFQNILLDMFKKFHQMCKKNNIRYYMVGGTLLGAVRHKGFIPWDDDIDIAIPRPDYERLIDNSEKWLPDNMILKSYKKFPEHIFPYVKILNKDTPIVNIIDDNYSKEGVIVRFHFDVYPIDGLGNKFRKAKVIASIVSFIKRIVVLNQEKRCISKNPVKRLVKKCIGKFDLYRLFSLLDIVMQNEKFEDSLLVTRWRNLNSVKNIVKKEVYGTPVLYRFEDTEFYGLEKAEEYLECVYGDYMKIPEVKMQIPTHDIKGTVLMN